MGRERRLLSNRASTASCSIRFSLRTIISGARNSIRRFKRLFRLITRRYRSFRSDAAKRPAASKGTKGRKSGGITGITSIIIQSGRVLESKNASTNFKRLTNLRRFRSELVSARSSRMLVRSVSRSMLPSRLFRASAPISAVKASSPYSSCASIYSCSVSSWPWDRDVKPGSVTT